MRIDAVFVEFDGVVADTWHARRHAVDRALVEYGVSLTDTEYWELCAGWPTLGAVRAVADHKGLSLDDSALDLLALRIDRVYSSQIAKGVLLADGARSSLERFAGRSRLAVVSRLRRADVESLLTLARLDHVFAFVIGDEDAFPGKPHAAPYAAALRRLDRFRGRASGTVVALEHGLAGIRAARSAGIRCVAVGTQPAHVAVEADAFVPSIAGLDIETIGALLSTPEPLP
jgi:beta-phosphoglucomutase-like phosphatase (HAD superfamily)